MLVVLTVNDIQRLAYGLGLSAKDFLRAIDFYILQDGAELPKGLEGTPQIKTERGLAQIGLKKMENGDCVFLKDNLCMIHSIRPVACMSFPFYFKAEDDHIKWGFHPEKEICPGIGIGPKVKKADLHDIGSYVVEAMQNHEEFVAKWNEKMKEPTALGFVESILREIESCH